MSKHLDLCVQTSGPLSRLTIKRSLKSEISFIDSSSRVLALFSPSDQTSAVTDEILAGSAVPLWLSVQQLQTSQQNRYRVTDVLSQDSFCEFY